MPPARAAEAGADSVSTEITEKTPGYTHDEVFKRYREQVPVNSDFTMPRNESMFSLPGPVRRLLTSWCVDPRDYICLELMVNTILTLVPLWWIIWGIPLWAPEEYQWVIHVAAPLMIVVFAAPPVSLYQKFILTLHVTSHRRIFPKKYDFLNKLNEIFLNPYFGIPPGSYYLHHVVMHHRENNVFPRDMSSTMPYQRDTITGLLSYCARYWTHQTLYLGYYAFKTGRIGLGIYYCVCWTFYLSGVTVLYKINPVGTLWMIIFSSFLTGLLLMQVSFGVPEKKVVVFSAPSVSRVVSASIFCSFAMLLFQRTIGKLRSAHVHRPQAPFRQLRPGVQLHQPRVQPEDLQRWLPHHPPHELFAALEQGTR